MMFKVDEGGAEGAVFVDFRSDQWRAAEPFASITQLI
jgi:hypothetical protein